MIRFEKVSLRYGDGDPVINELSLDLAPGSFHFLLGESGAGKSSLLRLMALSQAPSAGRITLFGRDIMAMNRDERALLRRRIGVVHQDFRLLAHLNVLENAALPLLVSGRSISEIRDDVVELLTWVELGDNLEALPHTLSGGQQQRLAIARAVVTQPKMILADEPTGSVDDRIALRLIYLFEELNKLGTTVVIASHNETLVRRFNHPLARLQEGRLSYEVSGRTGQAGDAP